MVYVCSIWENKSIEIGGNCVSFGVLYDFNMPKLDCVMIKLCSTRLLFMQNRMFG